MSSIFMDPENTIQQQRIAASRREWSQIPAKDLEQVGRFVVDKGSGNLYVPTLAAVFPGDSLGTSGQQVSAFYVDAAGEPIYLVRSQSPSTLEELRAQEDAKAAAQREREREHTRFLREQPRRTVTYAELQRDPATVPTLAQAVRELYDLGGRLEADGPDLRIRVPERLAENPGVDNANRQRLRPIVPVIAAGRNLILAEIAKGGKQPLPDRLPDRHVGPAGGLA